MLQNFWIANPCRMSCKSSTPRNGIVLDLSGRITVISGKTAHTTDLKLVITGWLVRPLLTPCVPTVSSGFSSATSPSSRWETSQCCSKRWDSNGNRWPSTRYITLLIYLGEFHLPFPCAKDAPHPQQPKGTTQWHGLIASSSFSAARRSSAFAAAWDPWRGDEQHVQQKGVKRCHPLKLHM